MPRGAYKRRMVHRDANPGAGARPGGTKSAQPGGRQCHIPINDQYSGYRKGRIASPARGRGHGAWCRTSPSWSGEKRPPMGSQVPPGPLGPSEAMAFSLIGEVQNHILYIAI